MKKMKKKPSPVILRFILPTAGLLLLVCAVLYFRPRPVWIVEDRYFEIWNSILESSPLQGPFQNARSIPLSTINRALPRSWYGYRIGSIQEAGVTDESQVRVFQGLSRLRHHDDALLLALDPWLVFRRFTSPVLNRSEAENGPEENGRIFMAGSDEAAIQAWAAQHLQEAPGIFPEDADLWEQAGERIFQSRLFQTGARTFSWPELWPHLIGTEEIVWVYAPLSRIRQLPLHETNSLQADVFPSRPGWTQFGIQAQLLWAQPFGSEKNREALEDAEEWLRSSLLQTQLADALGWLAAHPESPPFNPVSGNARISWLTSSYIWEKN